MLCLIGNYFFFLEGAVSSTEYIRVTSSCRINDELKRMWEKALVTKSW